MWFTAETQRRRDAETQSPQSFFIEKFFLCALCVSAVSYNFSHY
jgi:hypothetical protein